MPTEIINNGSSLKIINNGVPRYIMKAKIIEIVIVRDSLIKVDVGLGNLYNIFVDQTDVTNPPSINAGDLRDKIAGMCQTSIGSGISTEAKQTDQLTEMQSIKGITQEMRDKITALNDKFSFDVRISDETNPNVVFKGYSLINSATNVPCWAIQKITNNNGIIITQWAGGNKFFDKIWDNRKYLLYS